MTNLEVRPTPAECPTHGSTGPVVAVHGAREVPLGGLRAMSVRRTLPQRDLPTVGAWCFLDEIGPQVVDMQVLSHPHTGLQTVTWPVVGQIHHRDSVGSDVVVRPGQLNLMTAGTGIAHSELSVGGPALLHAVQLWIALPDGAATGPASFQQVTDLPVWRAPGVAATVMVGRIEDAASPARVHTPLLGADVTLGADSVAVVPLEPGFEHAVLLLAGDVRAAGHALTAGPLVHLGDGRDHVEVTSTAGGRFLLIGGAPFDHDLVMWWNFVGRTHGDVERARAQWESDRRDEHFGHVRGHGDERIPAPDLPHVRLRPRRRPATT